MIRAFTSQDMQAVLDIWLAASLRAHHFIDPAFWTSQVEAMRTQYLPSADVFVHEDAGGITGFSALVGQTLAALFVAPERQGQGIGSQLLTHAKQRSPELNLTVYRDNPSSVAFYKAHGFSVAEESTDPHTGQVQYLMRCDFSVIG